MGAGGGNVVPAQKLVTRYGFERFRAVGHDLRVFVANITEGNMAAGGVIMTPAQGLGAVLNPAHPCLRV